MRLVSINALVFANGTAPSESSPTPQLARNGRVGASVHLDHMVARLRMNLSLFCHHARPFAFRFACLV